MRRDGRRHGRHGGGWHGGAGDYTALAFAEPVGGGARKLIGFARARVREHRKWERIQAETDRLAPGGYRVTVGDESRRLEMR